MNNFSKIVTTFAVCKFLEEAIITDNVLNLLEKFTEECESMGGDRDYFNQLANRELIACRILTEQDGGASPVIANSVGGGGIAGLKPEDIGVPVSAQKRHTERNTIFNSCIKS